MKIIHIQDIRIIMKNRTEYSIKTPIGVFNDINDAINQYPYLEEDKRIKQCPICNKWFYDDTQFNKRKYCNDNCSKKAKSTKDTENYYGKIFVNTHPFKSDYYTQRLEDNQTRYGTKNLEYNQDDNYWGLGGGNLKEHKANNFNKEHKYIKNELKRLGLTN